MISPAMAGVAFPSSRWTGDRQLGGPGEGSAPLPGLSYLSLCSGVEAASLAFHPLGWHPVAFAQYDPDHKGKDPDFASKVLAYRFPEVVNLGDIEKFETWPDFPNLDAVIGGTPCQDFSIAGLRAGLAGAKGNLALSYLAVVERYRPRWVIWENVPGVRSSERGRDFGTFLGFLGELGYGWAYRSFDAQYAGLAQRRERVFVVGYLRDWRRAAAVLFERESLSGDSPPSREARQEVAPTLRSGPTGGGGHGKLNGADNLNIVAPTLTAGGNRTGGDRPPGTSVDTVESLVVAPTLKGEGFDASEDGTGRGTPLVVDISPAVTSKWSKQSGGPAGDEAQNLVVVPFGQAQITNPTNRSNPQPGDPAPTLAADDRPTIAFSEQSLDGEPGVVPTLTAGEKGGGKNAINLPHIIAFHGAQDPDVSGDVTHPIGRNNGQEATFFAPKVGVRRLTPRECERLQGMPDDWTLIPVRKSKKRRAKKIYAEFDGQLYELAPDGPRYKVIGNSFAVPVVRWLGERIMLIESLIAESEAA